MANPNAVVANGGDLTVGNDLFLPSIGPTGRLLAVGPDFEIIESNLTIEAAALMAQPSTEAIPNTVALRTQYAAIKAKSLIAGPNTATVPELPAQFTLTGAAGSQANDTFTKVSNVQYNGTMSNSIILSLGFWYLYDIFAVARYSCAASLFPAGPWLTAADPEPLPTLDASFQSSYGVGVSLTDSPGTVGARIVRDAAQTANLQEWADENGAPVTWIDKDGVLRGRFAPVFGNVVLTNGQNYGSVSGLALPFTPINVGAWVCSADALGPPLYVNCPRDSITNDGFSYYINAMQQDDSFLGYVCVPPSS